MKRRTAGKRAAAKKAGQASWSIGSQRFEKISAVEGVVLTEPMKTRRAQFERSGASAEKRREFIIKAYKR